MAPVLSCLLLLHHGGARVEGQVSPPATAGIGVPIYAKGQDEPEERAEEGDARRHRTVTA